MNIVEDGSDEVKDWKVSLVGRRMRMHRSQEKGGLALMPFASSWTMITARRRCAELNQVIETPTPNSGPGNEVTAIRSALL